MTRRKPLSGQASLPLAECDEPPDEPDADPVHELSATEWAELHLAGSMTFEDDEPWSEEELAWMNEHPADYERTP